MAKQISGIQRLVVSDPDWIPVNEGPIHDDVENTSLQMGTGCIHPRERPKTAELSPLIQYHPVSTSLWDLWIGRPSNRDYALALDFYFWLFFVLNSIFHFPIFTHSVKTFKTLDKIWIVKCSYEDRQIFLQKSSHFSVKTVKFSCINQQIFFKKS